MQCATVPAAAVVRPPPDRRTPEEWGLGVMAAHTPPPASSTRAHLCRWISQVCSGIAFRMNGLMCLLLWLCVQSSGSHSPGGGRRVSSYILLPLKLLMGFLPLSSIGVPRPSLVVLAAEMAFLSELTRTLQFCKPTSSPLATLHRWLASCYLICC